MEIEEIKKIIENAYAHIPTLPGYWIDYTKFEEEFHRILEAKGYLADTNIQEALEKAFPDYKKIDEYKSNDQETPIVAIRIAPNKLNRISKLKKHLIENINKTPEDKDGWKNFASLGLNGVKEEVLNLDFGSVRDAMNMIFPRYYEFRKGDIKMHETPLMFRSFKWEQEKNKNIQEGIVKENKKPATRKEKKSKIMEFSLFLPLKTGYDNAIKELATKALPEQWYYGDETHASFPILKSYLNYTFDRLCTEDQDHVHDQYWVKKIKVSDDGRFCVFNTGLVDQLYDPIYAWFGKNEKREGGWIFRQFVKSSDREMQTLTRIFGTNMPETAHYYNSTSELVYDIRRDIGSYNWDHFVQRCDRLPIGFLKDNGPAFDYDRKEKNAQFYKELSIAIQNDKSSYKRIKDRIIDAINNALKRVKWNFKTAIPIYYPGQRAISLLLPLALTDGETIDCALVLESTDSNAYIAHTILTLKMAYNDARLITRPDSDWLVANKISDVSTNMTV